ncbi:UDP-glucuronosyl/UDP-glucosyltransferase [Corchorus capsularis]|uniref:Glycosyltransferase n=1 Tax=Corchorus capsularis TaxID=210143 RepID=A0A1R3IBV5_COCAP|nr:UDP-glucuronosyl/UDP-glucosyltransferase [Corchorus capsularis]
MKEEMGRELESGKVAHVVFLPFPAEGHIKPMLKLAELLSQAKAKAGSIQIQITIINTQHTHQRLLVTSNLKEFQQTHPNIQFLTFPDGLPPEHPRVGRGFKEFISALKTVAPALREVFLSMTLPATCFIADMIMSTSAVEVANEFQVPLLSLQTMNACTTWIDLHLPKFLEEGEIPIEITDEACLNKPVTQITGLESFTFLYRDLPGFCRTQEVAMEFCIGEFKAASQASALIINTFEELEAPMISKISSFYSKIFTIGPLHCLNLSTQTDDDSSHRSSADGILSKEDNSCLEWLDSQQSGSVIYVSFGTWASLPSHVFFEFWHGLINSGKPFLWVVRPNSIHVTDGVRTPSEVLAELEEKSKGKGLIVSWVPQEKVLAHPAVGGFLTHTGWNSTLESIYAGIPMICWPIKADQFVNSKCVGDIWKIGFDMKDKCDRSVIEKMVRDLLGDKREEIMESVNKFRDQARQSVMVDGSSYRNLENLIDHIISLVP